MDKLDLKVKHSSLAIILGFCLSQICVIVLSIFALIFAGLRGIESDSVQLFFNTDIGYLLNTLFFDFGLVLTFILLTKKKTIKIIKKPKTNKIILYVLIAIISFLMLYPVVNCLDSWLRHIGVPINTIPFELNTRGYILSLFSLVLIPAIAEELLFRGLILQGFKKFGKVFSILMTALYFMIFHFSLSQALYPILLGSLLSLVMYNEDNIIYPIVIHLVNNFLSITLSYLNISLVFNHWTYILLAVILAVLFISVLMFFIFKNNKSTKLYKFEKEDKTYFFTILAIMIVLYIILILIA